MIIDLALICSAYLWAIVLHELGHWLYFRVYLKKSVIISLGDVPGRGTRLRVGCPADYRDHSATQKLGIYIAGIAAGIVPFIFLTLYRWPYGLLIIPYLAGCSTDIKAIARLHNEV